MVTAQPGSGLRRIFSPRIRRMLKDKADRLRLIRLHPHLSWQKWSGAKQALRDVMDVLNAQDFTPQYF